MASIFTHTLVGGTLAYLAPLHKKTKTFVFLMCFIPVIPDFDYAGFVLKVPYDSFWGHRGFTHSILFSIVFAALTYLFSRKKLESEQPLFILFLYFVALFSHPVLDALTNGGLGVAFYSPYNTARHFFPWRPIEVSPMGAKFFSERGLVVLISEFFWVWIPCFALCLMRWTYIRQTKD